MDLKTLHKVLGWTLAIPLIIWALTGIIFLVKPGYAGAYEKLAVQTYPMDKTFSVAPRGDWHEAKLIKTTLGYHLLLSSNEDTMHLDPISLQRRAEPTHRQLEQLIAESLARNPDRYGNIIDTTSNTVTTNTGVTITLDWETMSLRQKGDDTRLISRLYKIHSLKWWGNDVANFVFGALGIVILLTLVFIGLTLSTAKKRKEETAGM